MQVSHGVHHQGGGQPATGACAVTIGNFDGVHRGHQAMLALLNSEASHRGLPSCVLTFEPHPRDFFASRAVPPGRRTLAQLMGLSDSRFNAQQRLAEQAQRQFNNRVRQLNLAGALLPALGLAVAPSEAAPAR